jgi:small conductance mechanosensitive channel
MKQTGSFFRLLLVLAVLLFSGAPAVAAPLQQDFSTSQATHQSLRPAAAELGQQIQALVTGNENADIEPQETFGTRALGLILTFFQLIRSEGVAFITNFADLPQVVSWFNQQINDPLLHDRWVLIGQQLLLVLVGAFLAGWLADLVLLPIRRRVKNSRPKTLGARFGTIFTWLCLALVPVILFICTALALMDQGDPPKLVRYVVMTVVYAFAILRLIRLLTRFLLAPNTPALRLIPVKTPQAAYLERWIGLFSFVMVFGYYAVDVAHLMRVPPGAVMAFSNIVGFIVVVMTIVIIAQKRTFVSTMLRGDLSIAQTGLTLWQSLRLWLARSWHLLAVGYLVIGYVVTMLGDGSGFALMQRGTILTLLVLVAMWLAFYLTARLRVKRPQEGAPAVASGIYRPVLKALLRLAVWVLGIAGIAAAWGVDVGALLATAWGQRIMGSAFSITTTIVLVVIVYEMLQTSIERKLKRYDTEGNVIEVNGRARTLLPMVRNIAIIVLVLIVGLVTLSELGINIAPLLAGAGVIGVAIGFGSQTLVKDFLTGMFIILEDTIAVGDVVTIGDNTGVVEGISIRTIRLRDVNGALHSLPFSEITKIINQTKGYSYAVMDLGVAYDTDLKKAMEVMRQTGEELRASPAFQDDILEPTEVTGIEKFGDSAITLRCRIKTKPGKQWDVKYAYLLRIKERFDAEKIEIPYPTMQLLKATE